jgi:hypothetical protein
VLSTNGVLKGPETLNGFVVSQSGGVLDGFTEEPTQYSMMRVGEHYLLFGKEEARTALPSVRGFPRYAITGVWVGGVGVDSNGRVHLARASPPILHQQYDGVEASDLIRQVTELLP